MTGIPQWFLNENISLGKSPKSLRTSSKMLTLFNSYISIYLF